MIKHTLLCLICVLVLLTRASGETYRSKHFIIHTDLDPRLVKFIQANAEAYYKQIEKLYFKTGGRRPIIIYYSKTQADTQKLFDKHGIKSKAYYGQYFPNIPAIYTHQWMNDGGGTGWGTLFHEITHHFINLNYRNPPAWFDEGLACILGETSRIIKGNLRMGLPNPWREKALRNMIENGFRIDVKRLTSLSAEDFNRNRNNYHPTRALFYWIYEIGHLSDYLRNVEQKGYSLSVLEQTVNLPSNRISAELLAFIKKSCYAGAYLADGQQDEDNTRKKELFLKALELKPDYKRAQYELALCCYRDKDYERCKVYLHKILNDPKSIEYLVATRLTGHCYYVSKDYAQALDYYQKSLEYSDYYEYEYEVCYWMANCYHYLEDHATAEKFYKMFLDSNWEPEKLSKKVEHARKYQKLAQERATRNKVE
jgi:tetratricopeptide (TPR) repeat protein